MSFVHDWYKRHNNEWFFNNKDYIELTYLTIWMHVYETLGEDAVNNLDIHGFSLTMGKKYKFQTIAHEVDARYLNKLRQVCLGISKV